MNNRRRFTAEKKVFILREHLENQVKISALSEQFNVHPNLINRWKKDLFENAKDIFSHKHKNKKPNNSREKQLESKIEKMQEVITELTTENLQLRKKYFGET